MLVEQGTVMFELYINQEFENHLALLNIMMRLNLPDSTIGRFVEIILSFGSR